VISVPEGVRSQFPLDRLTTVRTGGPAQFYARAGEQELLEELLAWAAAEGLEISVVGSGSNLLVADEGVTGLVVKLDGRLAGIEEDAEHLCCGGGARLPAIAARAAQLGLSGIEFGVNIPGTVGGAVRMNANAYGGELARVIEWVDVVDSEGSRRRTPGQLGFSYRNSNLGSGEVVARARFALQRADPSTVRATLAQMRARRREAQPSGIRTFGSTFKNPDDPRAQGRSAGQLLDGAGCRGLRIDEHSRARFSERHANFVENQGGASTAEIIALMAAARARVTDRFGVDLEPEVQTLGPVRFPWKGVARR